MSKDPVLEAFEQGQRSRYIREGVRAGGYSHSVADLADMMRGDREQLILDMTEPSDRQAAEWFVLFLFQQQKNLRVLRKFRQWPQ
jgi:hypothetical protein